MACLLVGLLALGLVSGCQTKGDASSGNTTVSGSEMADRSDLDHAATTAVARAGLNELQAEASSTAVDSGVDTQRARPSTARAVRRGGIHDITFDDLELDMPERTLFERLMLTPRAAELDGQRVRIRGFIFAGGVFQQSGITSFPFVKNTQCKFGPRGLAYCVILVELDEGVTTEFTTYPVTVEGTLTVRPFNSSGFTWSVYHLQGRRVF